MPKEIDVAALELGGLENLIANHRARGATNSPTYLAALPELERRKGSGLDFDKSFTLIREAARQGNFLSYKQLADASGADWSQVHYAIGGHLWRLVEYAHRMGWPMLSAIVVNKPNVASGRMEPETIKGFIAAARDLGYSVTSEEDFLRQQQKLVFDWARST
jgi:hypothetical protein